MPTEPKVEIEQAMCRHCHCRFRRRVLPAAAVQAGRSAAVVCGRPMCVAMIHWTRADWEGRARMARARKAAGRILVRSGRDRDGNVTFAWSKAVLDAVDREALARVG